MKDRSSSAGSLRLASEQLALLVETKKLLLSGLLHKAYLTGMSPNELFWEVEISGPLREDRHMPSSLHVSENFGLSCESQSYGPVPRSMQG